MRAAWVLAAGVLSACAAPTAPARAPMTLPPPDGRGQVVKVGLQNFVVSRQTNDLIALRVTRIDGRDLDYSEGALAKTAAEAYCAGYNRGLDPAAMGRFSLPNAWVFGGDCL